MPLCNYTYYRRELGTKHPFLCNNKNLLKININLKNIKNKMVENNDEKYIEDEYSNSNKSEEFTLKETLDPVKETRRREK